MFDFIGRGVAVGDCNQVCCQPKDTSGTVQLVFPHPATFVHARFLCGHCPVRQQRHT